MADDYLDPRVNVVSSDADVERTLKDDKREGRNALSYAPVDWGSGGQVDRSAMQAELDNNPNLHARLQQMVRGEVGGSASPEVRRIQMESVMNRSLVRGHSLEQGLWDVGQYGPRGYYPPQTFSRGGYNNDDYQADLASVLGGSNYGGKYLPSGHLVTGNASADVARHQFQRGTPGFTLDTGSGPESYFNEDAHRAEPMARLLSGGGPMATALGGSRPPMQMASADITGSVPQGRRQMPTPMDEASSPGILDRVINGVQTAQNNGVGDTLQNVGAWLMARDNPAGGAALLAGLKKTGKNDEWTHTIDTNTGQVVLVRPKDGAVRAIPIPGYNQNKAADEARLKDEAKADVDLDTKLGEYGATLGSKRADLNEALKTFKDLPEAGLWNTDQGIAAQRLARSLNIPGFDTLPKVEKARAIAERLALQANTANGMRLLPGSESNSDRQKLEQMQANPVNTKEANMALLGIAERGLKRDEDAYKIHQGMTGNGFNRKAYYAAIEANDKKRAAEQAEAAAAQPAPGAPLQLPKGVKSIQLIQ